MNRKKLVIGAVTASLLFGFSVMQSVKTEAEERVAACLLSEESLLAMNQPPFLRFGGCDKLSPEKRAKLEAVRDLVRGAIGRMMVLRSELDLSEGQREQIVGIYESRKEVLRNSVTSVLKSRRALSEAITSGKSEQELKKVSDELGDAVARAALEFAKTRQQARRVLTTEQKKEIDETRAAIWNSVDKFREKVK